MRDAIRALPDGVYRTEIWNNPLGEQLHYPLQAHRARATRSKLDFEGAPPQLPQGGLNCTYSLHRGARDLSDEVHPQPAACAAMPAATGRSP